MIRDKVTVVGLTVLGLLMVLLYSGARTLTTVEVNQGKVVALGTGAEDLGLKSVLQNLQQTFSEEASSGSDWDESKNPLVTKASPVKPKKKSKAKAQPLKTKAGPKPPQDSKPKLTGLILDQDPVAIIEIGKRHFEVRKGDLLGGHKVIDIDERGVHMLVGRTVVTLQ